MAATMQKQNRQTTAFGRVPFGVLWALGATLGGIFFGLVTGNEDFLGYILLGLIIGVAQTIVLWGRLPFWWPVVSTLGWLGGLFASFAVPTSELATTLAQSVGMWEVFWLNLFNGLVIGAVYGLLSLAVFWRRLSPDFRWLWPVACIIGLGAQGALAAYLAGYLDGLTQSPATIRLILVTMHGFGWAAFGVITGAVLYRVDQRPTE